MAGLILPGNPRRRRLLRGDTQSGGGGFLDHHRAGVRRVAMSFEGGWVGQSKKQLLTKNGKNPTHTLGVYVWGLQD